MMSLDNHSLPLSVKKWKSIIVSATDIYIKHSISESFRFVTNYHTLT